MSIKTKVENPLIPVVKKGIEYHAGWVYTQKTLDIILGNQLAIIEAIGLPEKQEKAIKSQIRQALFRPQRLAMFISSQEVADHSKEEAEIPNNQAIPYSELSDIK